MYISIAKPIKANIVQHIMNHDVFNIMVTQADWDMNRVNDDGLNVMDLYLKDNDNIDRGVIKVLLNAKFDHTRMNVEFRKLIE